MAEVGPEGAKKKEKKKKEKKIVIKRGKSEPFGFVSNKCRANFYNNRTEVLTLTEETFVSTAIFTKFTKLISTKF